MNMSLNRAAISLSIAAPGSVTVGLANVNDALALSAALEMTHGSGDAQANQTASIAATLAPSASQQFDLAGNSTGVGASAIFDLTGRPAVFSKIKVIAIANTSAAASMRIGDAAANAWTGPFSGSEVIGPGGVYLNARADAAAFPVTASASDILKITNLSNSAELTFKLLLIGTR